MDTARDDTARAQIKLRLREPLRARLAAEAKRNECSLNTEIVQRLKMSLQNEEMGEIVFADRDIFIMVSFISRIIRLMEQKRGKNLREDHTVLRDALKATTVGWDQYCKTAENYIDNSTTDMDDFFEDTLAELRHRNMEREPSDA